MKQASPDQDRYVVKPVVGAFGVLEALVLAGEPMTLPDLARVAGLSKTTTFRYIRTLALLGYITAIGAKHYEMGPSIWMLGQDTGGARALRALADEELKFLSDLFAETVNLAIPNGKRLNYIAVLEPDKPLRFTAGVGDSEWLHCTALGKTLLAYMSPDELGGHLGADLPRFTEHTMTKRVQLQRNLAGIRKLGYAIDREENELGCVCYAAPIFGTGPQPIGALSVSIPTSRLTSRLDLEIPEAVLSSGMRISAKARRQSDMESLLAAHRSSRGRPAP
jgi:IclR family acetate operon transcriptional repressor